MGYWVDIQVKFDWDPARTPRDGGAVAGKAVANLLQLLHTYCYEASSAKPELEIKEWFRQIDQHYRGRLCDLGDFLALAENYGKDSDDESVSGTFHTAWVETESITHYLYALRDAILSAQPEQKWWYELDSTNQDLLGLIGYLNLVHNLGGNTIRLFVA